MGEILTEEGFGRLLRHPAEQASTAVPTPGRDTRLPKTAALDLATWPTRVESAKAGLLLLVPDLVALDLPTLAVKAGYPGTRIVPAASWLLSLLALKLTRTRRVSHARRPAAERPGCRAAGRLGHVAEEERAHRLLLPHQP